MEIDGRILVVYSGCARAPYRKRTSIYHDRPYLDFDGYAWELDGGHDIGRKKRR